jgi:protoporphyrin/coproporphyrin ferrochelatase
MPDYDAFLLLSFGGPEGPDDVLPFLENVTRGRGVPPERLAEVAEHYYAFGGVSPINAQSRQMLEAARESFDAAGLRLPAYWGNRNWQPYLTDTVREMGRAGVRRAIAFTTSAYTSYSSCRQYLDDIERARAEAGPDAPVIDKIRPYYDRRGFIEPFARATRAAIGSLPADVRDGARLVFTAHSIPLGMAATSGSTSAGTAIPAPGGRYRAELADAAGRIAKLAGREHAWDLVFQSRSGPPSVPWLEPDVCDHLRDLAKRGEEAVVVVPVGFVTDHMEVLHDLDTEAAQVAESLGLAFARAATPGHEPEFIAMITELVQEAIAAPEGPSCPGDCCRYQPVKGRGEVGGS